MAEFYLISEGQFLSLPFSFHELVKALLDPLLGLLILCDLSICSPLNS